MFFEIFQKYKQGETPLNFLHPYLKKHIENPLIRSQTSGIQHRVTIPKIISLFSKTIVLMVMWVVYR